MIYFNGQLFERQELEKQTGMGLFLSRKHADGLKLQQANRLKQTSKKASGINKKKRIINFKLI